MLVLLELYAPGLPCSGLSSCSTFSSFRTTPLTVGPTCDDDARALINLRFIQEPKEIEPRKILQSYKIFFLDRAQNYESNGIGFIIFGSLSGEICIFKV
jgi:hypothetical protein